METKILTLIIAAGGWIVVIIQTFLGFLERQKKHKDDILLKATEYFTGDTQKRSIGISLIEGMIKSNEKYYDVIIPLLSNQFVYLLLQSDTKSPIHEERNLVRIFFLLRDMIHSNKTKYHHDNCEVFDAISRRIDGYEKSTLKIAEQTLILWQKDLEIK
ncbi:MAG: hypothetical protein K8R79_05240 [Calditrichales bacterium]|nr:hypothetical protein [Calditrichales bacterium]